MSRQSNGREDVKDAENAEHADVVVGSKRLVDSLVIGTRQTRLMIREKGPRTRHGIE